ncbi:uncharacterized protein LOC131659376 [Vicia villosa]|uniref:uncharacterized protein LOC131659376 n=1 Tax=Vicia villosa TaxID=3911 RepID=UPI00273ACC3D|nr:uncharacterized protein LOC131659376 [Vicia villosa]
MEVLSALMRKAKEVGKFRGFKVDSDGEVDLLQFADDTIIISERDTTNLWSMKTIRRGFELMLGLRINFNKSNIYGINVGEWFLDAVSNFLACKVGSLLFKFLGVKVGGNPRKISMWKDLISFLKKSGGDLVKSIHWICWDTVCKPREEGGLGVRNVEIMNAALISKWKWRILTEKEAVWCNVLKARYDNVKLKVLIGDISVGGKHDSIWWRDVLISDNYERMGDRHFARAVDCTVGNGKETPFWMNLDRNRIAGFELAVGCGQQQYHDPCAGSFGYAAAVLPS